MFSVRRCCFVFSYLHAVLLHQQLREQLNQLPLSDNGNHNGREVPEQGGARNGYGCGSKGLGNADSVADRGNIARIQRCVIGQRQDQVAVVVHAAALDSDAVFTVIAIVFIPFGAILAQT
mgnify:CR=1 FL=1